MRLIINRTQADRKGLLGGHKGVMFNLRARLDLTDEERRLLDHYRMWDYQLFTRGQGMPISIRHLAAGDELAVENVEILLGNERVIKNSLDQLPALLEVLRTFGGDEVIAYPRNTSSPDED